MTAALGTSRWNQDFAHLPRPRHSEAERLSGRLVGQIPIVAVEGS
jgi:hypothetical protein